MWEIPARLVQTQLIGLSDGPEPLDSLAAIARRVNENRAKRGERPIPFKALEQGP